MTSSTNMDPYAKRYFAYKNEKDFKALTSGENSGIILDCGGKLWHLHKEVLNNSTMFAAALCTEKNGTVDMAKFLDVPKYSFVYLDVLIKHAYVIASADYDAALTSLIYDRANALWGLYGQIDHLSELHSFALKHCDTVLAD